MYFWQKCAYWEKIGRSWHFTSLQNGDFDEDQDKRCSILHVTLSADDKCFVDMEADEIKLCMHRLVYDKRATACMNKREISQLWIALVQFVERSVGTKIAYFRTAIELPGRPAWYPSRVLGNPIAFVVCDTKIISISGANTYDEDFNG